VVRTPRGWIVTLPDRREPTPIDDAALHALVRASGGVQLDEADPARRQLVEAGLTMPEQAEQTDLAPATVDPHQSLAGPRSALVETDPLVEGAHVSPLPAFVGRISSGLLLVETAGGQRLALDEVDLTLIEHIDGRRPVYPLIAEVRAALGDRAPSVEELSRRLRALARAGRLRAYPIDPPQAVPEESTGPAEQESVDEAQAAVQAVPSSALQFPGRRQLGRVRRRARNVVRAALGTPDRSPEASAVEVPEIADVSPVDEAPPIDEAPPGNYLEGEYGTPTEVVYLDVPQVEPVAEGAIPVYSVFQVETGPPLSLAMLTATARQYDDGALNERFEIRRVEDPDSFYADMAARPGPAVLLLSNYVWSASHNLEVARRARELNPELVIVHGGPSTPKYPEQCEEFFAEHGDLVDVAVRGEGEITLAEILVALAGSWPALDLERLEGVEGLTYRRPSDGAIVRNEERERVADLDSLPSPYLTGEFDHLDPSAWVEVTIESSRGCPYGCTFCDWGSSTLSRIRKFDLDRVAGEMHWAGQRKFHAWAMGDANFGIVARDVELTQRIVEVKKRWGFPVFLGFNVAKNTTKHLTAIVDELVKARIAPVFSLALQTRDEDTLEAIKRTNIDAEHYTRLASSMRRRGIPLQADLMIGLPGQTVDSFSVDLQFLTDHEIPARMWITHLLPNAPINDPEYREEWQVRANEQGVVIASKSFTAEDRAEMIRIRHAYTVFERFGILRQVGRFLQWDHGQEVIAVLRRIVRVTEEHPDRYPLLNWMMRYFDYFNVPPLGWRSFYREVRRFIATELEVPITPALESVLELQAFLMPEVGRTFPDSLPLRHDFFQYFQDHTRVLWAPQEEPAPHRRLDDYPPAVFTVYADPLDRCGDGTLAVISDPRNEAMTDDFWMQGHWEMDSPLVLNQPQVAGKQDFIGLLEQVPADLPEEVLPTPTAASVRVKMAKRGAGSDVTQPA